MDYTIYYELFVICVCRGGLRQLAAKGWIIVAFTIVPLVTGPVHSRINSNPWGAYNPDAITALESIQTHEQSLSGQVPIHSWVSRVHMQVSVLPKGTTPHRGSQDPHLRPLSPNLQVSPHAMKTLHVYGVHSLGLFQKLSWGGRHFFVLWGEGVLLMCPRGGG